MNIGVYLGKYSPEDGGGYMFQDMLLKALIKEVVGSKHRFVLIKDEGNGAEQMQSTDRFIWAALSAEDSHCSRVQLTRVMKELVAEYELHYLVHLTPQWLYLNLPYLAVIWDLQHRYQPFFPEVSFSPENQWQDRENHYRPFIQRAAHVLTGTERGREDIAFFYQVPKERISLAPHPTPEDCIGLSGDKGRDWLKPRLIYPAQFWPHKNHLTLLKACQILRKQRGFDFRLILTGADKGNQEYIQALVQEFGLSDFVEFRGFVSRAELLALYSQATCMTYVSLFGWENLPPLEAMAAGVPLIAAQVRGSEEQIGDAGLLYAGTDEKALADAIVQIHQETPIRENLIRRGRERAAQLTSRGYIREILRVVDEFEAVCLNWRGGARYNQLFGSNGGSQPQEDNLAHTLEEKENQIRILSQAADERGQLVQELTTKLQEANRFKIHWWTRLGKKFGIRAYE